VRVLLALDFNVGCRCSVIAQAHGKVPIVEYKGQSTTETRLPVPGWQRRVFYIIDEITIPNAGIENVVDEFLNRYEEHARKYGVTIYGDASGGARSQIMSSQSSVRTNYDAINRRLRARGINVKFRVQSANPAVMDRVNLMNAQFRSGAGFGALVDPHKCPEFITDLISVKFKVGTNDIDKSDKSDTGIKRTHSSDAAGYMFYVERRLEAKPNSISWTMIR